MLRRITVLILLIIVVLAACSSRTGVASAPETQEVEASAEATPEPTEEATVEPTPAPTDEPTPAPTPASSTFAVGDVITITQDGQDWATFGVLEVQESAEFVDPDGFFNDEPQTAGNVFLAAKVRYEALANGVDYNPFDFQIFVDGQAVDNVAFAINGPQPELSSGTLPLGRVAEGWLLYEVPPTGEVLLSYTGNLFLDEAPVFEVVLREG